MTLYHINPATGNPGRCSARGGNCPFGDGEKHYGSLEEARAAYETSMESPFVLSPAKLVGKKLEAIGVDSSLAEKAASAGLMVTPDEVEAELKKLPVYLGPKPELGDKVRVTRRTYDDKGGLESIMVSTGVWQADPSVRMADPARVRATGTHFVKRDGDGFDPSNYETADALQRAAFEYFATFRVRTEGVTSFGRQNGGVYFEHDTIEVVAAAGEENFASGDTTYEEIELLIQERRRQEKRAARPRFFRRS